MSPFIDSRSSAIPLALGMSYKAFGLARSLLKKEAGGSGEYLGYNPVTIKSGRVVYSVAPILKKTQRLLGDLVYQPMPAGRSAAYEPGTNICKAATRMCNSACLVHADIVNFYGSITGRHVTKLVREYYNGGHDMSGGGSYDPLAGEDMLSEHQITQVVGMMLRGGRLVQGGPRSPMISNRIGAKFIDPRVEEWRKQYGFIDYFRYSDNLYFKFKSYRSGKAFLEFLKGQPLVSQGFQLHKFSIAGRAEQQRVLGLIVNGDTPRMSRPARRKLEARLYNLERAAKAGRSAVALEATKDGRGLTPEEYIASVSGMLTYYAQYLEAGKLQKLNGLMRGVSNASI